MPYGRSNCPRIPGKAVMADEGTMYPHCRGPNAIRPEYFPELKRLVVLEGSAGQRRLWEALCATVLERRRHGKKPLSVNIVDVAIPSKKLWWLSSDSYGLCARRAEWDDFVTHLRRAARAVWQMLPRNALTEAVALGVPQHEFVPLMLINENGKKTLISIWDLRERCYDSRFSRNATVLAILPTAEPYFLETEYRYDFLANKSEIYSRWLPVIEGAEIIPPIPSVTSKGKTQSLEIITSLEKHWQCRILSAQFRFLLAKEGMGELQLFCTGSCHCMELLVLSSVSQMTMESAEKLVRFADDDGSAHCTRRAPCDGGFCHLKTRPVAQQRVNVEEIRWAHAEENASFVQAVAMCGRLTIDENMPVEPVSDPEFWTRVNEQAPTVDCCPNCAAFYHRIRHNYEKSCVQQQLDEVTSVIDIQAELRVERLHMGLSSADETMMIPRRPYIVAESTRAMQELAESLDVAGRQQALSDAAGDCVPSTRLSMTKRRTTAEFIDHRATVDDDKEEVVNNESMDDTFELTPSRTEDSSVNIAPDAERKENRDTLQFDCDSKYMQYIMDGMSSKSDGGSSIATILARALPSGRAIACDSHVRVLDDSPSGDSSITIGAFARALQVDGDVDGSAPTLTLSEAHAFGLFKPTGGGDGRSLCVNEAEARANVLSGRDTLDDATGGDQYRRPCSSTSIACASALIGGNALADDAEESARLILLNDERADRRRAAHDTSLKDDGRGNWADPYAMMTIRCDDGRGVGAIITATSDSATSPNVHLNTITCEKPRGADLSPIVVAGQDEVTTKDMPRFFSNASGRDATPDSVSHVRYQVECEASREQKWSREMADEVDSPDTEGMPRAVVATGETRSAVAAANAPHPAVAVVVREDGHASLASLGGSAAIDQPPMSPAKMGGGKADGGGAPFLQPATVSLKGGSTRRSQKRLLMPTGSSHLWNSNSLLCTLSGSSHQGSTSSLMLVASSERDQLTATSLLRAPSRGSRQPSASNLNRALTPSGNHPWETPVPHRASMNTNRLLTPGGLNRRPSDTSRPQSASSLRRAPSALSNIYPLPSVSSEAVCDRRPSGERAVRLICLHGNTSVFRPLVEYFRPYKICVRLSLRSNGPIIVVAKQPGDLLAAVKLKPACVILESAWPPRHPWTLCPIVRRGTGTVPADLFKGSTSKVVAASFAHGPLKVARDVIVCLVLHTYIDG
eukprot:GEMP01003796.1.p1 GENE.GEMP01003796.1~~GEMP01003796.1.p1  ORF type:complete len:1200 (+),score=270.44 GEMP01003796.1:104-3703(+)